MAREKRVNATRMELLRLRRRTALARKGHKLLKDKLDGLIQRLLSVVKEYRRLSGRLAEQLTEIFQLLAMAGGRTAPEALAAATLLPTMKCGVEITLKNLMGVKVPLYELKSEGQPISYGYADTPAELDRALLRFQEILKELVKLAELNKSIEVIAATIIEIKRRVNALEYVLIPELETSVRYIRMKLAEMERSTTVALLKIKDIVRAR